MNEVKNYINENKERFLSELFELIRIPSISSQSKHKEDMQKVEIKMERNTTKCWC